MTSWLKRTQAGIQSASTTPAVPSAPGFVPTNAGRFRDPNCPDARLDIENRCIYERRLPGSAYITAHVSRLQDGFYDSPNTHGDRINNVRFLAVSFVFHPSETINRFQAATVTIAIHDDTDQAYTDPTKSHKPTQVPLIKPKFLRFAPHVLFGGVSPETLDWNFNLSGSLGVSQTPVSASLAPSGGVKGSYKLYQMMRIQGSTRTLIAKHHHEYDIEDGEVCWTMEENPLQKSGIPREMTFVMLITKGDVENVVFDINIEPKVASWFGHYPGWWNNLLKYRPLQKEHMDIDRELGQRFSPEIPGQGYNFANLASTFNDFVSLPGTTYSVTDQAFSNQVPVPDAKTGQNLPTQRPKAPSRNNTQPAQSNNPAPPTQPAPIVQQNPSQAAPPPQPPQPTSSPEIPMDYHIYLHNPRTINLHATPPPPVSSPAPQHTQPPMPSVNIIRPQSAAPRQRLHSPANTKMKRRSIDISNLMQSPYYDEAKPTQRNTSGGSVGSLRRRHSKTDLRTSPVTEESQSQSRSRSRSQSQSHSRSPSNNSWSEQSRKENISPASIIEILQAPSPPDPGLSGFKARLQAHAVATTERDKLQPLSPNRDRNRDSLPFEVQSEPHRPPREITPSPDPTDNPDSNTTSTNSVAIETDDTLQPVARRERHLTRSPVGEVLTNGNGKADTRLSTESPASSAAIRKISPYADVKWDGVRNAARRRESSASLSPDEPAQPRWGDLKEEQRRRQKKRLSMPVYEYITEADGDWDNR